MARAVTRLWERDLDALTALRHGPIEGPDPARLAPDATLTLEITFTAPRSARRALLIHSGSLPTRDAPVDAATGWSVSYQDAQVELCWVVAGRSVAAWRSGRLRRGWHHLRIGLETGPERTVRPVGGVLDGRHLRSRMPTPWPDLHGELPNAGGLVVGGLRDRAGGHTDLRFGERQGELVERVVLWRGASPATAAAAFRDPTPRTMDVRTSLRTLPSSVRYWCRGAAATDRVVWDFEDEVAVGPAVDRAAALVPTSPQVHVLPAAGAGRRVPAPRPARGPRPVAVFAPGAGGYAAFRIPALVRAADGTLLAFAEGRRESISDSCRTKDLVLRRSHDGGRHWGPLTIAGQAPRGPGMRSLMNPSPVVDTVRGSGRIVLVGSRLTASEWEVASGRGDGRLQAWRSDDHGSTWSESCDVAAQLPLPAGLDAVWPDARRWYLQVGTLGHAIQLRHGPHRGRLCFVGHGTFGPASVFDAVGFLFWSDDLGSRWHVGPALSRRADGTSARGWNEGTLVELADGSLLLNARQYRAGRPAGRRAVARVRWDAAGEARPGPIEDAEALVDSAVQASLLAPCVERPHRLLFCNPAHPSARMRLTLRTSDDAGDSWPHARLLLAGRVGYSDLAPVDAGTVGVLFEHGPDGTIAFVRVDP